MKPIAFAVLIVSRALFLWFYNDHRLFVHPFTGESVSLEAFIWQIGNFVPITALLFVSIFRDRSWIVTTAALTIMSIFDYTDWILEGNNVWWRNGFVPISMNTLTGFVFLLTFMYEFMKYGKSGRCEI